MLHLLKDKSITTMEVQHLSALHHRLVWVSKRTTASPLGISRFTGINTKYIFKSVCPSSDVGTRQGITVEGGISKVNKNTSISMLRLWYAVRSRSLHITHFIWQQEVIDVFINLHFLCQVKKEESLKALFLSKPLQQGYLLNIFFSFVQPMEIQHSNEASNLLCFSVFPLPVYHLLLCYSIQNKEGEKKRTKTRSASNILLRLKPRFWWCPRNINLIIISNINTIYFGKTRYHELS